jgi:hypothetical protein
MVFCAICGLTFSNYSLPNTEGTCTLDAFINCQVGKKNIETTTWTLTKVRDKVWDMYTWTQHMHLVLDRLVAKKSIKEWHVTYEPQIYDIVLTLEWQHAVCIIWEWEDYWEVIDNAWVYKVKKWERAYFHFE